MAAHHDPLHSLSMTSASQHADYLLRSPPLSVSFAPPASFHASSSSPYAASPARPESHAMPAFLASPMYGLSDASLWPAASPVAAPSSFSSSLAISSSPPAPLPPPSSAAPSTAATGASSALDSTWSAGHVTRLRYQLNDHVQLLIHSRLFAQWWPQQNPDILRIQTNTTSMMDELQHKRLEKLQLQPYTTLDVPMIGLSSAHRTTHTPAPALHLCYPSPYTLLLCV